MAVGVVVGVVAGLNALHHGGGSGDPAVHPPATAGSATAPPTTDPAAPSAVSTPPVSAEPTTSPAPSSPAAPTSPPAPAPVRTKIVIYNATGIRGLTARAAAQLNGAGYDVKFTNDVTVTVGATTAYFDPPQARDAQLLVAANLGVVRALPRPRILLPTGTVIVVLADDYARR